MRKVSIYSIPVLVYLLCLTAVAVNAAPSISGSEVSAVPETGEWGGPLVDDADYDPAIPTPASILGEGWSGAPATGEEILLACRAIAAASARVELRDHGRSWEGRNLYHLVVGSAKNMARLPEIIRERGDLAAGGKRAAALLEETPAVVWIGGAVHGNEPSGADASLELVYHLAADRSAATRAILDNTVVVIDPVQNPDGRARFMAEMIKWSGRVPSLDRQSLFHRSDWPSGRGNHYFIDLNRDWFALSQVETRARMDLLQRWHPQVTFDLHEMGGYETYLFSPPRAPFNQHLPETVHRWWRRFSQAQGEAFGEQGWSCYSGDWNEEFNPNRGASWPLFTGAVALLGEQATGRGGAMLYPEGRVQVYREAVTHHFTAALVLIREVAAARGEILSDYLAARRDELAGDGDPALYLICSDESGDNGHHLADLLVAQGIEVAEAEGAFKLADAVNYWGERRGESKFPAGTLLVDLSQPQGRLARAILEFDPLIGEDFLSVERQRLEGGQSSQMYESTAWSLAMACAADVYRHEKLPGVETRPARRIEIESSMLTGKDAPYGFLLPLDQPRAMATLAAIHNGGLTAWGAAEPFTIGGREYAVGTVLIKRDDNPDDLTESLSAIAASHNNVRLIGIDGAITEEGPDLGGSSLHLLQPPNIALVAAPQFYQTSLGAVWYHLDQELQLPCSLIRLSSLAGLDLDRYRVIVVPDASPGKGPDLVAALGEGAAKLSSWIARGGTLITLGEASWLVFGGEPPLGGLRAQRQVLDQLGEYETDARHQAGLRRIAVDEQALRAGKSAAVRHEGFTANQGPRSLTPGEDDWLNRFHPGGAILRVNLDSDHWLCAGAGERVPVLVKTDLALMSRQPMETPGRFADRDSLRLSGLLWPEGRDRWALSSYLTREGVERGQVISFLGNPVYRAYFRGTTRLFDNAVLLGPGMGAVVSIEMR